MIMKKYLGVKLIEAEPTCENGIEGYKATYNTDDRYLAEFSDFVPKDIFEHYTRPITDMTYGLAIEAKKKGFNVARRGWNGKGQYVFLIGVKGSNDYWTYTNGKNDNYPLNPIFGIKNVNDTVSSWVPSINDVLAEDWYIVE